MKHGFLITAYTDAQQLYDLVDALSSPTHFFFINIDKKSQLVDDPLIKKLAADPNIFFLNPPVAVYWGGYSHLLTIYQLLSTAHDRNDIDYFHALSGQCFPVKKSSELDAFFISNRGKEFMTTAALSEMHWSGGSLNRIQLYHLNDWFNIRVRFWKRINSRFLQLQRALGVKRQLPKLFPEYYGGGTWWSLSKAAADHICSTVRQNPGLLERFRYTHCAEEIFFHTLLMNSPLRENIVQDDLRYVDWHTRNGQVPAVLDESDFEKVKSSGKLFARKFVTGTSDKLKELLRK